MKRTLTLFAACLFVLGARAQGELMSIVPDAQSLGMGGITMTNITGSHAIYTNPAASIFSRNKMQISGSYLSLQNNYYTAVSGFYNFDNRNLLQAGWRRYEIYPGTNDMSFDLGYSRRLGEKWSIGIVARYHRYYYSWGGSSKNSMGGDFSAMYSKPLDWEHYSTFRIGMKFGNLGAFFPNWGVYGVHDMTTMTSDIGFALDTFLSDAHELTIGLDLGYIINAGSMGTFRTSVGAEYNLMQLIQLRAGYHYTVYNDYFPQYGSVGAGVRFLHTRVDFAYLFPTGITRMENTWCISLSLDF